MSDADGETLNDSRRLTGEERYERASERYAHFNELVAREQKAIDTGEWALSGIRIQVYPLDGAGMDRTIRGMTRENSYCFEATRTLPTDSKISHVLKVTGERWRARGWTVEDVRSSVDGSSRVTATTEAGAWFALEETKNGAQLAAYTPPYWGTYMELADDVHERYEAEKARGEHARFDIDEDERLLLLPGDYRPFPRWDAVD
ncbi:hypothetical protein GCM10009847_12610 [Leucobacter tardus]